MNFSSSAQFRVMSVTSPTPFKPLLASGTDMTTTQRPPEGTTEAQAELASILSLSAEDSTILDRLAFPSPAMSPRREDEYFSSPRLFAPSARATSAMQIHSRGHPSCDQSESSYKYCGSYNEDESTWTVLEGMDTELPQCTPPTRAPNPIIANDRFGEYYTEHHELGILSLSPVTDRKGVENANSADIFGLAYSPSPPTGSRFIPERYNSGFFPRVRSLSDGDLMVDEVLAS